MITWCDLSYLKITTNTEPLTSVLKPLPTDTKEIKKDKKDKPFINNKRVIFDINYLGTSYCILIPKNYRWNGANIPRCFWWIIGSMEKTEFLNASMIHDIICENHHFVNYDRQLSSMIFREMLIASGVGKFKANIMYHSVDNFQKFIDWSKPNEC